MSNTPAQKPFVLYYRRVDDLLQAILREASSLPIAVHLEPLHPKASGWQIWGILMTARAADTIHAAWIIVGQAQEVMLTPYQEHQFATRLDHLYQALVAFVKHQGFVVRPGSYLALRQSAELPDELLAQVEGGQE